MNKISILNTFKFFHRNKHLAALLSGLTIILAFPPFEQGYLAWIALIPLLWASLNTSRFDAFKAGFIFSLPFSLYVNYYLAYVLYPYLSGLLATFAIISLVLYISLFYGLFSLAANIVNSYSRPWFTALALPALWMLVEYLRSLTFLAYNVGYLGYTQWSYPGILNIASVYGYWGLPFVMVFFQAILLLFLLRKLEGRPLIAVTSVLAIILFLGLIIPCFQEVNQEDEPLYTALIQGNISPERIINTNRQDTLEHYLDLTRQAIIKEPKIELVVWPETVVRLDFREQKSHPDELVKLGEKYAIDIIYGARVQKYDNLYNSVTLYSPEQHEIPVYKKHRLVPFVEFFPAEQLLNRILQLDLLLGSYTPGEEITIFNVKGRPVAGVICFESYFGDHMRLFARKGAKHQFIVTNDAWFNESIGLEQHAQAAAIRAAETGTGVTQVANTGITISFDYLGRELFRSGKSETAIFTKLLDMSKRETIYTRYGDFFPAFWAIFLLINASYFLITAKRENA